jgi:hypothetical protein
MGEIISAGCNGPYTLLTGGSNYELFHIYEIVLDQGEEYAISVDNLSPLVDLNIGVYPPVPRHAGRQYGGENAEINGVGGDETAYFTPSATGMHAVVVYRDAVADLSDPASYYVQIGPRPAENPTELVLILLDATVDPIQMRAQWEPVTEDTNGCDLIVNLYHLFMNEDMDAAFDPDTWTLVGSTSSTFLDFDVPGTIELFQMAVVAEDTDGLIIEPRDAGNEHGLTSGDAEPPNRSTPLYTRE